MVLKLQVFKKVSPDGKIGLFLTKREYVDHVSHVDPIEGVLVLDPNYVQHRRVFVQLALKFRFGREQDENMGYCLSRTLQVGTTQLYPPVRRFKPSKIQQNLMSKLGNFAFPFSLEFPALSTASCAMQEGWEDHGALMGVEFEVEGFMGVDENDMNQMSTTRMLVSRVQSCPATAYEAPAPSTTLSRTVITAGGSLAFEVKLSRPVYHPNEEVPVKVTIRNDTLKEVKKLKVKLVQMAEIPMFHDGQVRQKTTMKHEDTLNLVPGACTSRGFTLVCTPPSKTAQGKVFLQGSMAAGCEEVLAPSTILRDELNKNDMFGVVVSYVVRVKAVLNTFRGTCEVDVPFVLAVPQ